MSYAPYPAYKDSGIPGLGQVPEGWETLAIKRVSAIHNGSTPKSGEAEFWDGEILWATPDDLGKSSGKTLSDTKRKITPAGFASCGVHLVPAGSSILSTRAPIGHLAIAGGAMCFNQGCRGLVPSESLDSDFLYYVLLAANEELKIRGQGTTFIELGADQLASLPVVKPPIEEQTAIADFLDKKTTEIDDLIAKKEELLRLLAEQRTALITHAVTKGLNPNARMKPSGIDWLGGVPEEWDILQLRYVATPIIGLTYSPNDVVGPGEGTLVLRSTNIQRGKLSLHDNVYVSADVPEKLKVKAGDILVCSRNGSRKLIGKNALIAEDQDDWSFGAFTTVIRSEHGPFLYWVLNSGLFQFQSGRFLTSTINQLTIGVLNSFEVPFPPSVEQKDICDFLSVETRKIDETAEKTKEAIERLREYRTALITNAVTGKIKVA